MRNEKLFSKADIADWEVGFEAGLSALDIPELKGCVPEPMRLSVLERELSHDIFECALQGCGCRFYEPLLA